MTARRKQPRRLNDEVDEAARLGRELDALWRLYTDADKAAAAADDCTDKFRAEGRMNCIAASCEAVQARLATIYCTSREGAFAQVMLAKGSIDMALSNGNNQCYIEAANRLLYSAIRFLEQDWGLHPESHVTNGFPGFGFLGSPIVTADEL